VTTPTALSGNRSDLISIEGERGETRGGRSAALDHAKDAQRDNTTHLREIRRARRIGKGEKQASAGRSKSDYQERKGGLVL